jgi:hypothetical protein
LCKKCPFGAGFRHVRSLRQDGFLSLGDEV